MPAPAPVRRVREEADEDVAGPAKRVRIMEAETRKRPRDAGADDSEDDLAQGEMQEEIGVLVQQLSMEGMDVMFLDDMVRSVRGVDLSIDGVAELYSVPRVREAASRHSLTGGWSLDLLTGWDFACPAARKAARTLLDRTKPKLLIGSPVCTFFSNLMRMNWARMKPEEAEKCYTQALAHLHFAIELYRAQMDAGRLFLHEHPLTATSWQTQKMEELVADPRTIKVIAHQCMLGLMTKGPDGRWMAAKKPTGFVTNSPQIAARLDVKCDGTHPHQTLLGRTRTSRAAQYPPALCDAICQGLVDHIARERLGQVAGAEVLGRGRCRRVAIAYARYAGGNARRVIGACIADALSCRR